MTENKETQQAKGAVTVNAQYIKDLSFENPKSPQSLLVQEQPQINIALDVAVQQIQEKVYEVVLSIQAHAKVNEEPLFLIELHYAGVFSVDTEDPSEREMTLLVYCPAILFPYARRIVSDATRDGGFPPLMISPIDFMGLYLQKKNAEVSSKAENDNVTIN